eukprot:CAMPEP_0195529876 /NCGR_PEP_ID=MMETSP0794_2-20130614/32519_1 /TAXON_ID=515487 /ORGANISM="Stephanopyxis turris, Strain CCMP 815" /LENGTH=307 /DNA_ID=CAMNT_0040661251 /DNA_START=64 /DNA_END=987 /DNA_ORIENTATION=+
MVKDRRSIQQTQSRILDLTSTLSVIGFFYHNPSWFNPWNLSTHSWLLGGVLIRGAIAFYDHLVIFLIEKLSGAPLLPTRTVTNKPVRYVTLDTKSIVFLFINSIHEWIFVQRLCHYLWHSPNVSKEASDIGCINTVVALYVMFVILDVCYAPLHHILHMPAIYPLIHKHHHRQHYPTRGYLDAGNEHPIEHIIGVCAVWGAVMGALYVTGAHAVTIFVFFNVHAALAMLNHSPYDVRWNVVGLNYSVANHEMHHRKFTVNYAQYCMWYDIWMRTYADYEGPKKEDESGGKVRNRSSLEMEERKKKIT